MEPPGLAHLCDFDVALGTPIDMGEGPMGKRRIVPIRGGTVSGKRLAGRVLDVGADWQTIYADGTARLDARYAIETHDGAVIEVQNFGYRYGPPDVMAALARGERVDRKSYTMRTQPRFETGDPRYFWLNRIIAVGTAERLPNSVRITFFEVL
jgi:hypothetical protein